MYALKQTIIFRHYVGLDVEFVHWVFEQIIKENKYEEIILSNLYIEVENFRTTPQQKSKHLKKQSIKPVQKQY